MLERLRSAFRRPQAAGPPETLRTFGPGERPPHGGAYLEMWCRLPGEGEYFSKGLDQKVKGTVDWSSYEIPFRLDEGQRPDLIRLNIAFDGPGTVRLRNVELLRTPLR